MDTTEHLDAQDSSVIGIPPSADDTARWAYITEWRVGPQSNDRRPVSGSVATGKSSLSAGRSSARRQHKARFKVWSQSRHD